MGELKLSSKYVDSRWDGLIRVRVGAVYLLLSGHRLPGQNTKAMVVFRRQIDLTLFTAK